MSEPILVEDPTTGDLMVRFPFEDGTGTAYFCFSSIENFKTNEINCVLQAQVSIMDGPLQTMSGRINLQSESAKKSFVSSFTKLIREEIELDRPFLVACEMVKEHLKAEDESLWAEDIKAQEMSMLFKPFLVQGAPSVLFGKGGGAKTYLSLRMALSLAAGKPFMGFAPQKIVNTLFLDYEDIEGTFASRLNQLKTAEPVLSSVELDKRLLYFPAKGVSLPELLPALRKAIQKHNIGLIIVDSAVSACGGEPEKAETVARYFNSLASLGVTSLTIAHETKSENHSYPFGSVFWYNFPRSIWNVRSLIDDSAEPIAGSNTIETGLFHRKANNGPLYQRIPLKITFVEGEAETLDRVDIRRGDDESWTDELSIPMRIKKSIGIGMKTASELKAELGSDVKPAALEEALRRMKKSGTLSQLGEKGAPYILAKKPPPRTAENGHSF